MMFTIYCRLTFSEFLSMGEKYMGVGMHVINCHYHYFALVNGTDQLFKNEMNTSF